MKTIWILIAYIPMLDMWVRTETTTERDCQQEMKSLDLELARQVIKQIKEKHHEIHWACYQQEESVL